jgi:tetratricopeptide (TPR) repeat protein
MKSSRILVFCVLFVLFVAVLAASPRLAAARAWVSGRNPCSATMMGRYRGMIDGDPGNVWALGKLLRCISVKALASQYERRIQRYPGNYNFRVVHGNLLMRLKRYDEAAKAFAGAARLKPSQYLAHYRLAAAHRKLKKPEAARKAYELALANTKVKRLKKKILRALIDLTIGRRDLKKARSYFVELLKLDPNNRLLRLEFAQVLTRNLMYKQALAEYGKLLKRYRGNSRWSADLYKEIGKVYERMGKDGDAKKSYEKAMRFLTAGHWMRTELIQRIIAIHRRKNALRSLIAEFEKKWRGRGYFQWSILASLHDEVGDDDKAIHAYKRALAAKPYAIDVRAKLIALLGRLNRHKEAIQVLRVQVRLAPGEPRFHLELAQALWRERRHKEALAVLRRLGAQFGRDPSVHLALADLYNKWGKPGLALKEFRILVRIEPQDPGHLINLGEQFWQRGDKRRALATWKRLLGQGVYRTREDAYAALAQVYAEHDLNAEALKLFDRAIKLNPKKVDYRRARAMALQKNRQFDEAVEAWQTVIKMAVQKRHQSWRREARTAIIDIWHRRNLLNAKVSAYRSKFHARPPDLSAGYFMGEAHLKLKQVKLAEKVYQRILEIDDKQVEALLALEQIYREAYQLKKAIAILKRLAEVVPQRRREFFERIAVLYLQLYQDRLALQYAKRASQLASKSDASAKARLGSIYERQENWQAAIKAYREALAINSRLFKVYFSLARIYLQLGNHLEAVKLYHEVIRRSPDEEFVRRAARFAIDIDEYLGQLLELERELIPLAFTYTHKKTYRITLVKLYARLVPRLAFEKKLDLDPRRRKRAARILFEIGQRALKPLLEALSERKGTQRDIAVDVLGHLGNKNAAPPLVRLALQPPEEEQVVVTPPPRRPYGLRYRVGYRPPTQPKTSTQTALRVRALVAAGRLMDPRTVPDLTKLLSHKSVELREAAAWALSNLQHRSAVKPLIKALGDPKISVEIFACVGLGRQARAPLAELLKVLRSPDRRPEVRAACAFALGLTGDRRAIKPLLALLDEERDDLVLKAAWALGLLGARSATRPLSLRVWSGRGDEQRALAWALARSVTGRAYGPGGGAAVRIRSGRVDWVGYLRDLRPVRPVLHKAAVERLLGSASAQVGEGLRTALRRHRDLVLRILKGLDRHPQRLVLGMFPQARKGAGAGPVSAARLAPLRRVMRSEAARLARHPDVDIRAHALRLAAKVVHPDLVELVRRGLADPQILVRRAAGDAAVIAVAGAPRLRAAFVGLLSAGIDRLPWHEQLERIRRLGQLKAASALPVLQRFAASSHGFVAEYAVRALGRIGDRRALPEILGALRYPAGKVRLAAVRALVAVDRVAARQHLRRLVTSDPDAEVRAAAQQALR